MVSIDQRRSRKTRRWVLLADRISSIGITVGGVAVLGAVLGIVLYLVAVAVPLLRPARAEPLATFRLLTAEQMAVGVLFFDVDEYRCLGTIVLRDGEAIGYDLASGEIFWKGDGSSSGRIGYNVRIHIVVGPPDATKLPGSYLHSIDVPNQPA